MQLKYIMIALFLFSVCGLGVASAEAVDNITLIRDDNTVASSSSDNSVISTTTTQGNFILVFLAAYGSSGGMYVEDDQENVYYNATNEMTLSLPTITGRWFYTVPKASGALQITGHHYGVFHSMRAMQFTGVDKTSPVDWFGYSSSATSPAVYTNHTNDVVLLGYHAEGIPDMSVTGGFNLIPNGELPISGDSGVRRPFAQLNATEIINGTTYTATSTSGNIYGNWGLALKPAVVDEIIFTTTGDSFNPVIKVNTSLNPVVEWKLSDGTTSNSTNLTKSFGSSATRNQTLKVTPWNAVETINLGYYKGDMGKVMPNISEIGACHVSAVYGLDKVSASLKVFSASNTNETSDENTISVLNFDNFTELEFVECCYLNSLTNVSIHNLPSVRRLCFEQNHLTYLDLSECPNLEDLRGANQDWGRSAIRYEWGTTGQKIYHVCIRDNYNLEENLNYSQFPVVEELFVWNNNFSGALNPTSTSLTSVQAHNASYTSANFNGRFPTATARGAIELGSNELVSIDVFNCPGIRSLNVSDNHLNQTEVDNVLRALDSAGTVAVGYAGWYNVDLTENACPSANGIKYAHNLTVKNWTVLIDNPKNMCVLNKTIQVTQSGTAFNISNDYNNAVNMFVTPSSGIVNVTVRQWDTNGKVWNESSDTHSITTQHIMGSFPASTNIQINCDGAEYTTVRSNSTGYITWEYTGGYSEHEFSAEVLSANSGDRFIAGSYNGIDKITLIKLVIYSQKSKQIPKPHNRTE